MLEAYKAQVFLIYSWLVMAFDEGPFVFRINDNGGGPNLLFQVRSFFVTTKKYCRNYNIFNKIFQNITL